MVLPVLGVSNPAVTPKPHTKKCQDIAVAGPHVPKFGFVIDSP